MGAAGAAAVALAQEDGMARIALVVSHPDDEALFFGGLVLSQPEHAWDVICCTVPRIDPVRAWKFFDACEVLSAKGRLLPYQEPEPNLPLEDERMALLDLEGYDRIVTHGREAEYGHRHHLALHRFITERWGHKEVWTCCPPGKSDFDSLAELSPEQLGRKMAALQAYDHVLPYEGVAMTKYAALIKRYAVDGGWDLGTERYRISRS
jgi:LmbE family N-acetylglucosaminyl deacetylase